MFQHYNNLYKHIVFVHEMSNGIVRWKEPTEKGRIYSLLTENLSYEKLQKVTIDSKKSIKVRVFYETEVSHETEVSQDKSVS